MVICSTKVGPQPSWRGWLVSGFVCVTRRLDESVCVRRQRNMANQSKKPSPTRRRQIIPSCPPARDTDPPHSAQSDTIRLIQHGPPALPHPLQIHIDRLRLDGSRIIVFKTHFSPSVSRYLLSQRRTQREHNLNLSEHSIRDILASHRVFKTTSLFPFVSCR